MSNFFNRHPVVFFIAISVFLLALIVSAYYGARCLQNGVFNGNRQVVDTVWGYPYGIVKQADGRIIEGKVESWLDFGESDMLQITFVDKGTYFVHSINVTLKTE